MQRVEAFHQETLEYEAKQRQETELSTVKAETDGKIRAERENRDLRITMIKEQFTEKRDTLLKAISLAGGTIGGGMSDFLGDKERMTAAVATITAVALGIYGARTSTEIVGRMVERNLGKPSLIRETSRSTGLRALTRPLSGLGGGGGGSGTGEDVMKGIILPQHTRDRLLSVATATKNTKNNAAPFRHLLLYGPPGTGKTLFAKVPPLRFRSRSLVACLC